MLHTVPSVKAAVQWLNSNSPDLVFSDIQLADGISFDIFKQVQVKAPVIFCTAYDEYAIKAFEANSIDYLLKPIDDAKLNQSLAKYKSFSDMFSKTDSFNERFSTLLSQLEPTHKSTLLIHQRDRIIPLKLDEVFYACSENGIVTLYTKVGNRHAVNQTLDDLESIMNPAQFFRVNRQYIINRAAIAEAEQYFGRRLLLKLMLRTPSQILVSKAKVKPFLIWVET